jgi:hypothetical protein
MFYNIPMLDARSLKHGDRIAQKGKIYVCVDPHAVAVYHWIVPEDYWVETGLVGPNGPICKVSDHTKILKISISKLKQFKKVL